MSVLSINHNLMASRTANTLSSHYRELATSTQRLSSGLRINGAADDAAGLAIRELMRTDIAALNQGARNANDAISMIQTFDGALSVIDEKLIRMKELAEQAATGTYDSTQRLMIDSEFQAMASEITRIARATDFNGIKLLDGEFGQAQTTRTLDAGIATANVRATTTTPEPAFESASTGNVVNAGTGAIKPGTPTVTGADDLAEALGVGEHVIKLTNDSSPVVTSSTGNKYILNVTTGNGSTPGNNYSIGYDTNGWYLMDGANRVSPVGNAFDTTATFMNGTDLIVLTNLTYEDGSRVTAMGNGETLGPTSFTAINNTQPTFSVSSGFTIDDSNFAGNTLTLRLKNTASGALITQSFNIASGRPSDLASFSITVKIKDNAQTGTGGNTPGGNTPGTVDPGLTPEDPGHPDYKIPEDVVRIHFGPGANHKEDFYDINKHDATIKGLGLEGVDIQTQEKAQEALVKINDAIVTKDGIRAEYGAMQNRLENTLTNLKVQSENIQAAESRISDTDIALEMTNFVRNQILTQSAVAMLAQANSMPQLVMNLIG